MWRYLFVAIFFVAACSTNNSVLPIKITGEAQGTYYSIIYYDSLARDFQFEIDSLLDAFDQSVSLWVPGSILSKVNNNIDFVILDKYFIDNFHLAKKVAHETNGAFDFTIGSLVKAWGFGYDNQKHVDSIIIDSLLKIVGYEKVDIIDNRVVKQNKSTTFDFNAIAQGYSVDMIGEFLNRRQIDNFLVDIGGEVMARGQKPDGNSWKVGIEKPAKDSDNQRDLTAIIKLENQSVATSGNYRKFFEKDGIRYSHMINPATGYPARHNLLSVSVIADNTALADAYATACMIMGLDKSIAFIEARNELDAFFIYSNDIGEYEVYATDGFSSLIISEFKE
ncbi:MAG: FAD:protein FMN transferase [Bacteroidetes bacterium]|nr:FAD:protein FMN transferase [Bacteroidota bacterium]MBL6943056.1 FAD:protein FMN transferase [Bacteroidales bacterium]